MVVLPAHLQVTGAPELEISPTFLDFGSVFVHGSATRTVAVANVGTDALTIAGIASDHPDFVADASSFTVPAAESRTVTVTYTPSVPGAASATLSMASDDADEPEIAVELQGEGLTSPDVTVSPASFDESLFTGQGATRTLTIGNTGGAPLTWRLTAAGGATLEDVLAHLESEHGAITATIPNRYNFSEGEFGTSIGDGGSDMYDGGNILSTQLGGPIVYTNGGIVDSPVFGPSGRYFTRKYPGLFVLAANVAGAVTFAIEGDLGADGGGFADGTVLDELVAGVRYLGFVKRVHGAGDPSVNHLLIVEHRPELQHEFSSYTNDDFHALFGMSGSTRLYYLLYAGSGGTYIDDQATRGIFTAFLQSLGPRWLSAAPEEGVVPSGGSTGVSLSFDATGLIGGDYATTIAVSSDDPDEAALTVPVHLRVTGAADLDVAPASVNFGPVFVGSTATRTVFVSNIGTDVLEVSTVTSDHADFAAEPTSFSLAVGEGRDVTVTYAPSAPGAVAAALTFTSNDPDDPEVAVPLEGEGRIPPDVSASPASFSESLLTGQTVTRMLTIENTGGSALDFEISVHTPPASVRPLPIGAVPPIGVGVSQSGTLAGGPADGPSTPSLQGTYSGTHLAFGITNHGEIMPFQSPPGLEHLESGTFLSGHTVAYVAQGQDHACYAVHFDHACLTPQSYREVRNTPQSVEVEVISRTTDGALRIVQTITFQKSTRYFVMSAKVTNLLDTVVEDVVLKWVTDWDVDGEFFNHWDYDPARNAVLAWSGTYVAVAGVDSPAQMDLYGWNDYFGRSTVVDYPSGPVVIDGAGLLHFDLGSLPPAVSREARVVFGAGPDLATLQKAIDAGRGTAQWIQLDTTAGTVPAGSSLNVPVTFVATGLIGGDYEAAIVVASNDPDEPEVSVPAHLHVTGAPDVDVTPTSLDFGPVFVGDSAIRTVTVTNDGTDALTVAGLTLDHPDFAADPSGFTLAVGESRDVSVTYAPSAAVPAAATLVVASDDPDEPQAATALQGQGLIPPLLGYSRSSFSESLLTGQTVTRTLTFDNRGGSDLTFSIRVDSNATGQLRAAPSPPAQRTLSPFPAATPRYDADRVPSRTPQRHPFASPAPALASFPVLLVQGGGDTEDIRQRLLEFSDISLIHVFDALQGTPALEDLLPYPVVLVANNNPFEDPIALGDVLADYVDAGGGVVLTLASFVNVWSVRGRFMDEGYSPFGVGTGPFGDASLGTYDATHPIMDGVTTAVGDLLGDAPLKPNAKLVAAWDNALPFVATQGDRVVAVNIYVANAGFWLGDIPRILHNALFWASGDKWLSTDPLSGVVAAGQTLDVAVTFDAAGLNGGDYDAALVVSSNDPHRLQARIPAFLHVTGAPDVEVTPLSLEFGVVYLGSSATQEVRVANPGTAPLGVTAITFDHGDFTADASSFTLAPHQSRTVHVTYAPSAPSAATSTMTIATDDPDEAQVALALRGEGRIPPDIATAPASFSESLFTGETVTRTLTIENTGGSDLTYQVSASTSADLAGQAHVLLVQDVFPWDSNANQTVLSGLGIAFDTVGSEGLASVDLGRYTHILVPSDQPTSFYFAFAANKARIDAWVGAGGVLEFHAAGWGWAGGDASFVTLPGGMHIQPHGADQNFVLRPDHPLVEDVPSPFSGTSASHAYFTSIPAVATLVASDDFGRPNLVVYRQGAGLVVAGCQTFEFEFPAHAAGRILSNMIPWADSLVSWLSLDPESGTVPAGGSAAVAVTFDATDLLGGDYQGAIRVRSNDPDEPERTVPMQLHVTGAPDIEAAPTSLDFGSLFVGATSIKTLSVTNEGTDVLTVVSASFDHPDFTGDTTGFTLAVGESRTVTVTYAPSTAGSAGATLTLASDDPDEPEIAVSLAGVGVIAPDIAVDPASVAAILAPGAASTRLLTVTNSGGSDLAFQVRSGVPFVGDVSILLLTAGADVDGLAAQLAALPDVGTVHQFDAGFATPTLEDLAPYTAIVVISGLQEFEEAEALGNVLASYVDGGGGVILTFSSFLAGWEVRGRFSARGVQPLHPGLAARGRAAARCVPGGPPHLPRGVLGHRLSLRRRPGAGLAGGGRMDGRAALRGHPGLPGGGREHLPGVPGHVAGRRPPDPPQRHAVDRGPAGGLAAGEHPLRHRAPGIERTVDLDLRCIPSRGGRVLRSAGPGEQRSGRACGGRAPEPDGGELRPRGRDLQRDRRRLQRRCGRRRRHPLRRWRPLHGRPLPAGQRMQPRGQRPVSGVAALGGILAAPVSRAAPRWPDHPGGRGLRQRLLHLRRRADRGRAVPASGSRPAGGQVRAGGGPAHGADAELLPGPHRGHGADPLHVLREHDDRPVTGRGGRPAVRALARPIHLHAGPVPGGGDQLGACAAGQLPAAATSARRTDPAHLGPALRAVRGGTAHRLPRAPAHRQRGALRGADGHLEPLLCGPGRAGAPGSAVRGDAGLGVSMGTMPPCRSAPGSRMRWRAWSWTRCSGAWHIRRRGSRARCPRTWPPVPRTSRSPDRPCP